jgi:hypothetical protein
MLRLVPYANVYLSYPQHGQPAPEIGCEKPHWAFKQTGLLSPGQELYWVHDCRRSWNLALGMSAGVW